MDFDIAKNKELIIKHLRSTGIEGIDDLIEYMDNIGFFAAPCSTQHHLACEGGLAEHSLNVHDTMGAFALAANVESVTKRSVIITSMLHDLGKCGQFDKPFYIPNMVDSRKKDEQGNKIYKQSEAKPFASNPELQYIDHEIRSVVIASQFIELTEDEQFAILYHNGLYGPLKYSLQGKETPLYMLLHFADMWASRVIEKEEKDEA